MKNDSFEYRVDGADIAPKHAGLKLDMGFYPGEAPTANGMPLRFKLTASEGEEPLGMMEMVSLAGTINPILIKHGFKEDPAGKRARMVVGENLLLYRSDKNDGKSVREAIADIAREVNGRAVEKSVEASVLTLVEEAPKVAVKAPLPSRNAVFMADEGIPTYELKPSMRNRLKIAGTVQFDVDGKNIRTEIRAADGTDEADVKKFAESLIGALSTVGIRRSLNDIDDVVTNMNFTQHDDKRGTIKSHIRAAMDFLGAEAVEITLNDHLAPHGEEKVSPQSCMQAVNTYTEGAHHRIFRPTRDRLA